MLEKVNELKNKLATQKNLMDTNKRMMGEARSDMQNLSQIVQDMTKLNNELNEKVNTMNDDMEKINAQNFHLQKKAELSEELEKNLEAQGAEGFSLLAQTKKANQMIDYMKKEKAMTERVYNKNQDLFKAIEEATKKFASQPEGATIKQKLTEIRTVFKEQMVKPLPGDFETDEESLRDEVNDLKMMLLGKDKELRAGEANARVLQSRITDLERIVAKKRAAAKEADNINKAQISRQKEELSRLKKIRKSLHEEMQKKDDQIALEATKFGTEMDRMEVLRRKYTDMNEKNQELESTIKSLREN